MVAASACLLRCEPLCEWTSAFPLWGTLCHAKAALSLSRLGSHMISLYTLSDASSLYKCSVPWQRRWWCFIILGLLSVGSIPIEKPLRRPGKSGVALELICSFSSAATFFAVAWLHGLFRSKHLSRAAFGEFFQTIGSFRVWPSWPTVLIRPGILVRMR